MARHKAPIDKRKKAFSDILGCLSFVLFAGALFINYQADWYPPVRRSIQFFKAPALLLLISLIWVTLIVAPLNIWIQRRTGVSGYGFTLAVYLAIGISSLLGLSRLGLLINGANDRSSPRSFSLQVLGKDKSSSSKGGTTWYLYVQDWRYPDRKVQLTVTKSYFDATTIGSSLQVVTKSGFLGFQWIVSPTWRLIN